MINISVLGTPVEQIRKYYEEAFERMSGPNALPEIDVSFYPYVGLNQTIRVRESRVFVRIADMCRDMPPSVHRALAYILVAKLSAARAEGGRCVYSEYVQSEEMRERSTERKRSHGRKVVTTEGVKSTISTNLDN